MIEQEVANEYFKWLCYMVGQNRNYGPSYSKLLARLHEIPFTWSIPKDKNRERDGLSLRRRFGRSLGYEDFDDYIHGDCSVLEMMVALAIRCEEDIMDNPAKGDRTGQWFWQMIASLGLMDMYDDVYNEEKVDEVVHRFLDRRYKPDGRGGLFRIRGCLKSLRDVEIWMQMLWYLDTIA